MADPFVGQISIVAFDFAPQGYAFCNGQTLSISQNTALFSLLGTTYGGNGTTTFALPNFQGRAPVHPGQGTGLSAYVLGQSGGVPSVTLTTAQLPTHTHAAQCQTASGVASPSGAVWGTGGRGKPPAYVSTSPNASLNAAAVASTGGGQAHNNLSPYLGLSFCIALVGIYPSRN